MPVPFIGKTTYRSLKLGFRLAEGTSCFRDRPPREGKAPDEQGEFVAEVDCGGWRCIGFSSGGTFYAWRNLP